MVCNIQRIRRLFSEALTYCRTRIRCQTKKRSMLGSFLFTINPCLYYITIADLVTCMFPHDVLLSNIIITRQLHLERNITLSFARYTNFSCASRYHWSMLICRKFISNAMDLCASKEMWKKHVNTLFLFK